MRNDPNGNLTAREAAVGAREAAVGEREKRCAARERASVENLRVGDERVEHERLVAQTREANENLVLATIHANELADECRRHAAAMAVSEERFRSLVITSTSILFHASADGRIRVDPTSWSRLTGLDAVSEEEEEPGWGWLHAVPPDDRDQVREAWARATSTRQVYTQQHRLRQPDGRYAWVMARAVPLTTNGKVREWVGSMTDISDRIRLEEAREHFIAVLGHDLRNPVNTILLSMELLTGHGLPEQAMRTIARAARSGARIEAMIRDMLDFARGRLGHGIPIVRRPCDLWQISRDEIDELRQAHPDRTIRCESTGDVTGEWDPDRVEQVLSNLVGNALEQGTGPIRVQVDDGGADVVVLSIHNDGPPIPPDVIPTLFEPYRRKLGDLGKGLGLGLYIVSQIVRAHHATIAVSSHADEGTTFTIRWPRSGPAVARNLEPSAAAAQLESASILQSAVRLGVDKDDDLV